MTSVRGNGIQQEARHLAELDRRYGKIGISAVSAALQCEPGKAAPADRIGLDAVQRGDGGSWLDGSRKVG